MSSQLPEFSEEKVHSFISDLPVHYSGKYKGSFAYLTIKDRLPVILVKVVDFLYKERNNIASTYGEAAGEEAKEIIGKLSALQNEMVTNKLIKPLISDNQDVVIWNEYLSKQEALHGFPPAWFESSWLYVECYLYRRMKQAFELSTLLQEFDPFRQQKEDSFFSTMDSVVYLCSTLEQTLSELKNSNNQTDLFQLFRRYLEMSLWSNKWDLSISAGKENVEHHNPLSQLNELREKILANDTETVWEILQNAQKTSNEIQIDVVLDNAGFELFCDLIFMLFLTETKLVSKIHIYVKAMPWFVSDTLEQDIQWLLKTLAESSDKNLVNFSRVCSEKLTSGQWIIIKHQYWTLPHDYSEMLLTDKDLYVKLSESSLVFFKGDLNYRKLTGDRQWEETTPFETALCGFLPTHLVTLRTIKADVVVGLKSGTSDSLSNCSNDWKYSGDYAVIQCAKKVSNA